jgi:hypothetical protein
MFEIKTLRQASPRIEKEYLELPNIGPCNRTHSLPRGMEHSRTLLAQLAIKLTGLVWRVRDLSGTLRLAYFNAFWQTFVTLDRESLFAYIGNLRLVDYVDETIQMRIYQWLVSDSSTLPFAER